MQVCDTGPNLYSGVTAFRYRWQAQFRGLNLGMLHVCHVVKLQAAEAYAAYAKKREENDSANADACTRTGCA